MFKLNRNTALSIVNEYKLNIPFFFCITQDFFEAMTFFKDNNKRTSHDNSNLV